MSDRILAKYEKGDSLPSEQIVSKIADKLNLPSRFFFLDDIAEIGQEGVSFRSLARTPAAIRNAALGAGQIALEFSFWLEKNFSLPEVDLPPSEEIAPGTAAEVVRNTWGIGELPIDNMVHLLESKGFFVFSLCEQTLDLDAYSFWMGKRPFIFLNTNKSVERSRFDAAHELGHIFLHKHGGRVGKVAEIQANKFASSFLMPQNSIKSYAPSYISLEKVYELKKYWKVSAAAYVRRLYDLNIISEWHYRSLTIDLSRRGELKKEPHPISARETSKLLSLVFSILREEGKTKKDIADALGVFTEEIDSLIFGLTLLGIDGRNKSATKRTKKLSSKYLRRVK
jgi:Zn-dependent peptidase ImmA (M78 family)